MTEAQRTALMKAEKALAELRFALTGSYVAPMPKTQDDTYYLIRSIVDMRAGFCPCGCGAAK